MTVELIRRNSFDAGVDGGVITAANSGGTSGNPFSFVFYNNASVGSGGNAAVAYAAAAAVDGPLGCHFASTGTSSTYLRWDLGTITGPYVFASARWKAFPGAPTEPVNVLEIRSATLGAAYLKIRPTGAVRVADRSNTDIVDSQSPALVPGESYTFELAAAPGTEETNGYLAVTIYRSDGTVFHTWSSSTVNAGVAALAQVRIMAPLATSSWATGLDIDNAQARVATSAADWIGPFVPAASAANVYGVAPLPAADVTLTVAGTATISGTLPAVTGNVAARVEIPIDPEPIVPVHVPTRHEILTGPRLTRYRYELLNPGGRRIATLDGVEGGRLTWTKNALVRGGGQINLKDTGQSIAWATARIRAVALIDGLDEEIPLGVWIPSTPTAAWADTGRSWPVDVLSKETLLDVDKVDATYVLPAGTNIIGAVIELLASVGENGSSLPASTASLPTTTSWPVGTSKLTICNDLLTAANMEQLHTDLNGAWTTRIWIPADVRPTSWDLVDDEASVYTPNFTLAQDQWSIPNRVVVVGRATGSTAAMVAVAMNINPDSPYSFPARGRWIVHTETGREAVDQAALDAYARRRLLELTAPASTATVTHALLPGWDIDDVVRFANEPAQIDARFTINSHQVDLNPTALASSTLQEVIAL